MVGATNGNLARVSDISKSCPSLSHCIGMIYSFIFSFSVWPLTERKFKSHEFGKYCKHIGQKFAIVSRYVVGHLLWEAICLLWTNFCRHGYSDLHKFALFLHIQVTIRSSQDRSFTTDLVLHPDFQPHSILRSFTIGTLNSRFIA